MGCYNEMGCLSKTAINHGEKVVLFLCMYNPTPRPFYACDNVAPILLPIHGKYDDDSDAMLYDIVGDDNVKWIEEHIGKIEHVIEAFRECDIYHSNIGSLMTSPNEVHPDKEIRYVYDKLLEQIKDEEHYVGKYIDEKTQLTILFEHEYFYKKWQVRIDHAFDTKVKELLKDFKKYEKKQVEVPSFFLKEGYHVVIDRCFAGLGSCNSYNILALYKQHNEDKFLIDHPKEVTQLQNFLYYAQYNHINFNPCISSGQDYTIDEDHIQYHKDCLTFLEKRFKKLKKEMEEDEE